MSRARERRLIESLEDVRAGVRALKRRCPHMKKAHAIAGDPPLRREPGGFRGLAEIVVGQMLSLASADAIWARLAKAVEPFEPDVFLGMDDDALLAAGLSRPKVKSLRAIAGAFSEGGFDANALVDLSPEDARERLVALPGIGPWSADIYSLFCLGHRDAFAPGDLALQIAAERLMELDERPGPKALDEIAERWRPWRGVAARQLWAYYRTIKGMKRD